MWHLKVAALYTEEDQKSFSSHVQWDRHKEKTEARKSDFITSLVESGPAWSLVDVEQIVVCKTGLMQLSFNCAATRISFAVWGPQNHMSGLCRQCGSVGFIRLHVVNWLCFRCCWIKMILTGFCPACPLTNHWSVIHGVNVTSETGMELRHLEGARGSEGASWGDSGNWTGSSWIPHFRGFMDTSNGQEKPRKSSETEPAATESWDSASGLVQVQDPV